jgi:superfamily II DNA or RNA helicase
MSYFSDNYARLAYPKEVQGQPNSGLRKSQRGAMHSIASHFTNNTVPALVVMPTGSGKSAVLATVPYLLESNRVLVITPSQLVREQIAEEIEELKTLKRLGVIAQDVPPPETLELTNRITTAAEWEALREYDVVVAAPPSVSPAYAEIPMPPADLFDLLLIDEAHHEQADTWQALLNAFKSANRVLFTATPYRRDGREIKAKLAYVYHVAAAFEDKIFGKVRFSAVHPQGTGTEDVVIARETERIFNLDKANGLRHCVMVRTDQKTRAKQLEDVYKKETSLRLQSINSSHGLKHIRSAIQKLRDGALDGVICVDMMGEGFDFPNLKIAAIHSPHRSLAVTLQFIGRFARTNAPDVGEATFIAVPQEVGGELSRLYREGAIWHEIITDLHGGKIVAEQENREIIDSFEEPLVDDLKSEDVPLSTLFPYHHVKVFKVADHIDIHKTITLRPPLEVVHHRVTPNYEAAVIVAYEQTRPDWSELPLFREHKFELFVVYYHPASKLLFINASRRGAAVYQHIARQYTNDHHYNLSLERINGVLRDIEGHQFFNIGMKNRSPNPNTVSYSITAGPSPGQAIDETVARLNHRGHVFGKGKCKGKDVTIGNSSASKVWSNTESSIPDLIKWCESLALRMMSEQPMPKMAGLDLLLCGKEIKTMPENAVIGVDWHPEVYRKHLTVVRPDLDGTEIGCEVTSLDLRIDRAASDGNGVRVIVGWDGWEFPIQFSIGGMPQFAAVDPTKPELKLKRGFNRESFIDFLKDHPFNFYLSDFSRIAGIEHFDSDLKHEPFSGEHITVIDWVGAGVEITIECGPNSIQDHMKSYLVTPDHEVVLHDHGTGEIADFVTVGVLGDIVVVKLYHVKGSGGAAPGNRVDDVYEVCGQVVKSLIWLKSPQALLEKIRLRRQAGSAWIKGDDARFEQLFQRGKDEIGFQFQIGLVQPGISKSDIEPKLGEVIAAARTYIKSCASASIIVCGSA